jgi:hypothetical protein
VAPLYTSYTVAYFIVAPLYTSYTVAYVIVAPLYPSYTVAYVIVAGGAINLWVEHTIERREYFPISGGQLPPAFFHTVSNIKVFLSGPSNTCKKYVFHGFKDIYTSIYIRRIVI